MKIFWLLHIRVYKLHRAKWGYMRQMTPRSTYLFCSLWRFTTWALSVPLALLQLYSVMAFTCINPYDARNKNRRSWFFGRNIVREIETVSVTKQQDSCRLFKCAEFSCSWKLIVFGWAWIELDEVHSSHWIYNRYKFIYCYGCVHNMFLFRPKTWCEYNFNHSHEFHRITLWMSRGLKTISYALHRWML